MEYCCINCIAAHHHKQQFFSSLCLFPDLSVFSRRTGSREDGIRNPVWWRCVTTAPFSSSCSAAGHPGVWLLVETPCSVHSQGEVPAYFYCICMIIWCQSLCPPHLSLSLSLWFTALCSLNSDELQKLCIKFLMTFSGFVMNINSPIQFIWCYLHLDKLTNTEENTLYQTTQILSDGTCIGTCNWQVLFEREHFKIEKRRKNNQRHCTNITNIGHSQYDNLQCHVKEINLWCTEQHAFHQMK